MERRLPHRRGMWRTSLLCPLLALAAPRAAHAQVSAEAFFRPGSVALTLAGGGAAFSPFQRSLERPDTGGASFRRSLAAGTSAAVGADLTWWAGRAWGLRAHASYLPSRFVIRYDRAGEAWQRTRSWTGPAYAHLGIWTLDVSLLLKPRFTLGRLAPYGILGAGVLSYRPGESTLPPEAETAFQDGARTAAALVGGIGGVVPLQRGHMLLSFGLTDHVATTPVARAEGTGVIHDVSHGSSLQPGKGAGTVRTHHVSLLVGLTIPLRAR